MTPEHLRSARELYENRPQRPTARWDPDEIMSRYEGIDFRLRGYSSTEIILSRARISWDLWDRITGGALRRAHDAIREVGPEGYPDPTQYAIQEFLIWISRKL